MVCVFDYGASAWSLSPGGGHCVVFFILTLPLSTQVYVWVSANLMLESSPAMD